MSSNATCDRVSTQADTIVIIEVLDKDKDMWEVRDYGLWNLSEWCTQAATLKCLANLLEGSGSLRQRERQRQNPVIGERMSLKWTHPTKTQTKKTMDSTRQRKDKEITKKRHATRGCLWQAKHTFCWSESVKTKHTFWSSESVKPWHLLQVRPTNWGHPSCAPYDDLHLLQHEKSTQSFQLFLTRCEELILFLIWTHMKHIKIWYINIWTRIEILHVFQACTPMSENTTTGSKRPWEESSQWAIWERTLES